MSGSGGNVIVEEAYAVGKMLEHEEWQFLPRGITPSDTDWFIHNRDSHTFLRFELKYREARWARLDNGQREAFAEDVRRGDFYLLCSHNVTVEERRKIRSLSDVEQFEVTFMHDGRVTTSPVYPGNKLKSFVEQWFADPDALKSKLLMAKAA